ncbi:NACHT domain-containing protein [Brumimicrobium oceani]|uniref:Toll-Interleukin receptor n=1 Tax=Brumimicrobium oceani TaxID=2100725 RepID=A0A2U2XG29_9FLAO|nr:toll-Interleukin receptor [Brumimicrobium oceani]PWH86745.1 toll-Interleukin receptor [Brumimicrobium oceani]
MKNEIIKLIQNWKEEVSKDLRIDGVLLFGSAIYMEGRMFKPSKSDLDLIVLIPENVHDAIERRNWIAKLKTYKEKLEKDALFLLKKEDTNEQIVSIVPLTRTELDYNIHKGETRNFFEINEFLDIDTGTIFKGSEQYTFKICESEFIIQVLKSVQKARNSYLTNSAMVDYQELEWEGEDIIPKTLAREAAKIASFFEENCNPGDELNTSFGCDFIKQSLKLNRSVEEYLDLYTWIDDRNGGRSNSKVKNTLSQKSHLLLFELLYNLTIQAMQLPMKKHETLDIKLTNEWQLFLEDTEMLSKAHSSKQSVLLSDIYVSPLLKEFDDSKDELEDISFSELTEALSENRKILIAGEGQSGKTTLCKRLFSELFNQGLVPIYLSDGKNKYLGSIDSKIEKSFNEQYGESDIKLSEIEPHKLVLILDDFHFAKHKEKIIGQLIKFEKQIIMVDDIFGFNFKNETLMDQYKQFKINEFSPSQRNELIKNWVLLSDNNWTTDNEIYQEIDNKTELVDSALGKIIGKGIMPSYPFFILSFISNYDTVSNPLDQNITSQGYFYQTLVYIYLRKESVKNDDFDTYFNFLTELAFFYFKKEKTIINKIEFEKYLEEYKSNFNLTIGIEEVIRNLRNTNILHLDGLGNYSFSYPYLYYFFAAKYFADNANEQSKNIDKILGNLHIDEFAYIAIFISHHDKNTTVLDEVVLNAMTLFEKYSPATLSADELSFFDERIDEVVQAVLPQATESAENHRNEELKRKDEIEKSHSTSKKNEIESELEDDELAIELRRSIKTVEVMGKIIKNRAGSLKKDQLESIFKEGMNVHLRVLTSFIELIKNKESQSFVEEFIARRLEQIIDATETEEEKKKLLANEDKLKKIARNIFWNVNFSIIYSFNSKIIHSLGSNKLINVVENVCDLENTPATFIIKHGILMWYNKSLQIDEIYDKIESDGFSRTAKRIMEHKIVNHCQTHSMGFREHQKIEQRSRIPKRVLLKRK